MAVIPVSVVEALTVADQDTFVLSRMIALTDGLIVNGGINPQWRISMQLRDLLTLTPSTGTGAVSTVLLAVKVLLAGTTQAGVSALLREHLGVSGQLSAQQATVLREALRLVSTQAIEAYYTGVIREMFGVSSGVLSGFGGWIRERLTLRPTIARSYTAIVDLQEELELEDVLTPKLMLIAIASDGVVVNALDTLQAIYNGTLSDTIDFIIDTVDPSGDVTTWAMNVRTGAVTEYLNYSFNAFGRTSSGTYLGAADDGLYELTGTDDAGTPVIADMISGLAELTGGFLTSIKAAYLAVRAEGDFFLKLTAGTGQSYTYRVKTQSLKTARIDIGKGLRARFFTFELVSTGQEFDLQGLTFIPVQSVRRV